MKKIKKEDQDHELSDENSDDDSNKVDSNDDCETNNDDDDVEKKKNAGKKRGKYTRRACTNCKSAHAACDSGRPCKRCILLGKEDSCVDSVRKKRKPAAENIYTETYEPMFDFIELLQALPDYVPTPDPHADRSFMDDDEDTDSIQKDSNESEHHSETDEKSRQSKKKATKKKTSTKKKKKIKKEMKQELDLPPPAAAASGEVSPKLGYPGEEQYFRDEFGSSDDRSYLDILQERISSPSDYDKTLFGRGNRKRSRFDHEYDVEEFSEDQITDLMSKYENNRSKIDSLSSEVSKLQEQLVGFQTTGGSPGSDEASMDDESDLLKLL